MSCTSPIYALDLGIKENGKRNIKILPKRADCSSLAQLEARYGVGSIVPLPCGKCLACRKTKAREWAVRCVLEASEYDDNCFITLTYDDLFYIPSKKRLRSDLTNFFKRLRKDFKFRYFACCEAGSQNKRYHFHALLFGVDLKKQQLEKYWQFGFIDCQPLVGGACFYVAQYAEKKVFSVEEDYSFITMSNRPGIGYSWLQKHLRSVKYGKVFGSFGEATLPRYFEKISEIDLSAIKQERMSKAKAKFLHEMLVHGIDRIEKLNNYQAQVDIQTYLHKERRKEL